jgi:hypothetical protein
MGPRSGLEAVAKGKTPSPHRELNPDRPSHSLVIIPTVLSHKEAVLVTSHIIRKVLQSETSGAPLVQEKTYQGKGNKKTCDKR